MANRLEAINVIKDDGKVCFCFAYQMYVCVSLCLFRLLVIGEWYLEFSKRLFSVRLVHVKFSNKMQYTIAIVFMFASAFCLCLIMLSSYAFALAVFYFILLLA